MPNNSNSLLASAARGWLEPKLRGGSVASHIERAAKECRALAALLESISQRARIEETILSRAPKMENKA
jgi:hypothetical protein